jgi:uncharacterized coiled-coil DUF342 family protein
LSEKEEIEELRRRILKEIEGIEKVEELRKRILKEIEEIEKKIKELREGRK